MSPLQASVIFISPDFPGSFGPFKLDQPAALISSLPHPLKVKGCSAAQRKESHQLFDQMKHVISISSAKLSF